MGTGTWEVGSFVALLPHGNVGEGIWPAAAPSPLTAATREPVPGRRSSPRPSWSRLGSPLQEGASDLERGLGQRSVGSEADRFGGGKPLNPETAELAGRTRDGVVGVGRAQHPAVALEVELDPQGSRRLFALGDAERVGERLDDQPRDASEAYGLVRRLAD